MKKEHGKGVGERERLRADALSLLRQGLYALPFLTSSSHSPLPTPLAFILQRGPWTHILGRKGWDDLGK